MFDKLLIVPCNVSYAYQDYIPQSGSRCGVEDKFFYIHMENTSRNTDKMSYRWNKSSIKSCYASVFFEKNLNLKIMFLGNEYVFPITMNKSFYYSRTEVFAEEIIDTCSK